MNRADQWIESVRPILNEEWAEQLAHGCVEKFDVARDL
jgi:hypothetical protein